VVWQQLIPYIVLDYLAISDWQYQGISRQIVFNSSWNSPYTYYDPSSCHFYPLKPLTIENWNSPAYLPERTALLEEFPDKRGENFRVTT